VEEIKKDYLKNLNVHYVNRMEEVIEIAIEK
jgi:ATP-dependent Lon protease